LVIAMLGVRHANNDTDSAHKGGGSYCEPLHHSPPEHDFSAAAFTVGIPFREDSLRS